MKRFSLLLSISILFSAQAVLAQPMVGRQQSNTMEIAPQKSQQSQRNIEPRITSQPSQRILVIPKASRDFVGEWGGHLQVDNVIGRISPPEESVVSLAFGQNNGDVFMRTTAFGNPLSHIVDTKAKVQNPRKVVLELEGIEMGNNPPLRHVEHMSLALISKDEMDCLKYVDFYLPGNSTPIASVDYHGRLKIIGDQERRALETEVLEQGEVPQSRIECHRNFGE